MSFALSAALRRPALMAAGLGACLALPLLAGPPALAAEAPDRSPTSCSCPSGSQAGGALVVVDGFGVGALPDGLGGRVSDFDYEWEDVVFSSKVWERGPDETGAYSVDLTIKTLRGERLRDATALRHYLAEYHEKDPATWTLTPYDVHGKPGFLADGQVFWLDEPGVAVAVSQNMGRFDRFDLLRTACSVKQVAERSRRQPSDE